MKIDLVPFRGKKICVALSGGGDSMALFDYLLRHAAEYSVDVCAAHLEHGIRGEQSKKDAAFVRAYCEKRRVFLYEKSVSGPLYAAEHKPGLEEGARALRYAFFAEVLKKGVDLVCTAHHADDNAETVLFNLFRGSALKGAGGIAARQGKIVRPMLGVGKEEISAYLAENEIPFVEDETNADTRYTRNFLRANVLPAVKEIFPACCERVYSFSRLAREDDEYLYGLAERPCHREEGLFTFPHDLPRPLFLRACVLAFHYLGGEKDYTQQNCEDIYALRGARNGAAVHLPFSLVAAREYDQIAVYRPREKETAEYPFAAGEFSFGGKRLSIVRGELRGGLRFDGAKLPAGCVVRARREGDYFEKFGGGTKKLKDYFIDKKIPLRERNFIPLIARGNEVYAVCGVEISAKVKIDRDSGRIYTIILQ